MSRDEFVKNVALRTGGTAKDAKKYTDAILAELADTMKKGESVQFLGFGSFGVKNRPARTAFNPRTKEQVSVPAKRVPVFRPGKNLCDEVK